VAIAVLLAPPQLREGASFGIDDLYEYQLPG
jgi:hypothetical protein